MKKLYHLLLHPIIVFFLFAIGIILINSISGENTQKVYDERYMENYNIYAVKIPDYLEFSGERVPLERWFVKESLDRELLINTYWHSNTFLMIKRTSRYFPLITPILAEEGVPDDFKYLALIESGLQPTAISPAKAVGLWQFMVSAAKSYGLEINKEVDERYNIERSTRAACQYLKNAKKKFGTWTMAAAAYNMGATGLLKQMKRQHASYYYDMLLNSETARYVYRILAAKIILNNPKDYGFRYREEDLYQTIPTYTVIVDSTINDWSVFSKNYHINYYVLKMFNPWLRETKLTNKSKKTYQVKIPYQEYVNFEFSDYNTDNK